MCKKCNISSGSLSLPHIKLCFHQLAPFLEFLKGHELGSVFREHTNREQADLTYTAYDAKSGIFVTCTVPVPLLEELLGLGVGTSRGYHNQGFSIQQNQGLFCWQNKRYWTKGLRTLNVNTAVVSSLEKIKTSELGRIVSEDDDDETEDTGQISKDKTKSAPFPTTIACDAIDGALQEVTVDVGKQAYGSQITYKITVHDWSNLVATAIEKFEKQVTDQGITVVPGSLHLLGPGT